MLGTHVTLEERVPRGHSLRKLRALLDGILVVFSEYFTADGTLIEACVSVKNLKAKDGSSKLSVYVVSVHCSRLR